jgi:hypothetical protein
MIPWALICERGHLIRASVWQMDKYVGLLENEIKQIKVGARCPATFGSNTEDVAGLRCPCFAAVPSTMCAGFFNDLFPCFTFNHR